MRVPNWSQQFGRSSSFLTYVSGGPFQPAVAVGLRLPDDYYQAAAARLRRQRDQLCDGLVELGFDVIVPAATYFATADVHTGALEYCRTLPARAGVVAIPSSVFYDGHAGDNYVRFAFCKQESVIEQALQRLQAVR